MFISIIQQLSNLPGLKMYNYDLTKIKLILVCVIYVDTVAFVCDNYKCVIYLYQNFNMDKQFILGDAAIYNFS